MPVLIIQVMASDSNRMASRWFIRTVPELKEGECVGSWGLSFAKSAFPVNDGWQGHGVIIEEATFEELMAWARGARCARSIQASPLKGVGQLFE